MDGVCRRISIWPWRLRKKQNSKKPSHEWYDSARIQLVWFGFLCFSFWYMSLQHLARFYVLSSFGMESEAQAALLKAHDSAVVASATHAKSGALPACNNTIQNQESGEHADVQAAASPFSPWVAFSLLCKLAHSCSWRLKPTNARNHVVYYLLGSKYTNFLP